MMTTNMFSYYNQRIVRKLDTYVHEIQKRFGVQGIVRNAKKAEFGIYVAYYDASWVFEDHLRSIQCLTDKPFNYYVMGNCTSDAERNWFNTTISKYNFITPFFPNPRQLPLNHAESLQRMVDKTDDEIIILCDVDAFPVKRGWDKFILKELETKKIVAVAVDMPHRKMPVFLHPCFMAFRRDLLVKGKIDLMPDDDNDPACEITKYLKKNDLFSEAHVTPLLPTARCLTLSKPGVNEMFGHRNLVHGFGTTYADLVFHFWFARHIAAKVGVTECGVRIEVEQLEKIIQQQLLKSREICEREQLS